MAFAAGSRGPPPPPPRRPPLPSLLLALALLIALLLPPSRAATLDPPPPALPPRFRSPLCPAPLCLPAYEALHAAARSSPSAPLLVLTQTGGWGNLYLDLAHAFAAAVAHDRAFVLRMAGHGADAVEPAGNVDWRGEGWQLPDPLPQPEVLHMDRVNRSERVWSVRGVASHTVPVSAWDAELRARLVERGLDPARVPEQCMVEYLVQPAAELVGMVEGFLPQLAPNGGDYAAVHVRTGSGEGSESGWNWFVSPAEAVATMPGYISRAVADVGLPPSAKIFVAADDPSVGAGLRAAFPGRAVVTNTKLTLMDGLHTSRGAMSREGTMLAFADWFLLLGSRVMVQATKSSFSTSVAVHQGRNCTRLGGIRNTLNGTADVRSCVRRSEAAGRLA
ncbi:hypothetical protein DFJ74DRAFT_709965 [Hyaloraphidium curvatum]|nr:hypothetical protein DFJ74DRAFT_709965 [Hyaloraphidium curvatum]